MQCDAEIDPASISHATCYLTVDNPIALDGQGNAGGYETLKLTGNPDPASSPKFITLRPTANALQLLNAIIPATPPGDRGILARLTVKGNFIWDLRTGHSEPGRRSFCQRHECGDKYRIEPAERESETGKRF